MFRNKLCYRFKLSFCIITRDSINIHGQCPEVNFPTIQLFSTQSTIDQKRNSSRANTQSPKPVISKHKGKQIPLQAQMLFLKQHSLSSRLCRAVKRNQSNLSVFLYNSAEKQRFASQQRLGLNQYAMPA